MHPGAMGCLVHPPAGSPGQAHACSPALDLTSQLVMQSQLSLFSLLVIRGAAHGLIVLWSHVYILYIRSMHKVTIQLQL